MYATYIANQNQTLLIRREKICDNRIVRYELPLQGKEHTNSSVELVGRELPSITQQLYLIGGMY